ncbi:LuxR C-terminal-related transcriptional regulator [Glycomyces tritici]|uniref:LuxR C-terminal-related transcriptional regulator n=1 Tax=Glycomyces tritici TaxID=2665176 RepID=A0ABT7YY12_9ACTN|nr:LuxR C-terminal-related transcriptional regulator [Glycomyces tritici]MDN3243510.1 LuxR C-terminal-related transcriptional regulator [Glycomyces tritici]
MAAPPPTPGLARPRVDTVPADPGRGDRDEALHAMAAALAGPGLVVVTGPPGCGRTRLLERLAQASKRPVHAGGGLAMLSGAPALALERATRARMPADDLPLLAEAVYSRTRGGLLVIDDLQWCDAATLAVLPVLAERLPVAAALRTPNRLTEAALARLLAGATVIPVPDLTDAEAARLVAEAAPALPPARAAALTVRAGGNPLALTALAKRAAHLDAGETDLDLENPGDPAAAAAAAIADLPRAGRTALAALGLLGRPAHPSLLGDGAAVLQEAGLAVPDGVHLRAASPWMAEVAAGILDHEARLQMHEHLADATMGVESARHAHAAGLPDRALATALAAAETAGPQARAEALLLAADLDPSHAVPAARAALAAGRTRAALAVLDSAANGNTALDHAANDGETALARAWALLALGESAQARAALAHAPAGPETDQLRLLCAPPSEKAALAEALREAHPDLAHPGLAAALAGDDPDALAFAEALARDAGDATTAFWCAWSRVIALADAARLVEAEAVAHEAADRAGAAGAYSWQTRFLAAAAWCLVLSGTGLDNVIAAAQSLADHALPAVADTLIDAAIALAEADTGALGAARARLARLKDAPAALEGLVSWLEHETAWLDGQPGPEAPEARPGLVGGLAHITGRWIAYDTGTEPVAAEMTPWPVPVASTLSAWDKAAPGPFAQAATAWDGLAAREQVRCLLALAAHAGDAKAAVTALEAAERIADEHGLIVLAGRARRGLRKHDVRRDRRSARGGGGLTDRESEVLRHVASGHPSRRIAEILGITAETVETHIRSGMRKLGAKTRTEAAVILTAADGGEA